ncbi:hypothetical protein C8R45DRAFT_415905 [Mycena sanguinolenta]|nr:hypothetical protein C8R45DRAFT_415905 [Mycena sanguinolenta]
MKLSTLISLSIIHLFFLAFTVVSNAQQVCVNGACEVQGPTQCQLDNLDDPVAACPDTQGDALSGDSPECTDGVCLGPGPVVTSSTATSSATTVLTSVTTSSSTTTSSAISVITLVPSPGSSTSIFTQSPQLVVTANPNTSPAAPSPSSTITLFPSQGSPNTHSGTSDTTVSSASAPRRLSTPAIIGILIGALGLLCLAAVFFLCRLRRRRNQDAYGAKRKMVLDPEAGPGAEAADAGDGEQGIRAGSGSRASPLGDAADRAQSGVSSSTTVVDAHPEMRDGGAGTALSFHPPSYSDSAHGYQNTNSKDMARDGAINLAQREKFDSLAARAGKGMGIKTYREQDEFDEDGPPEYELSVSGCA